MGGRIATHVAAANEGLVVRGVVLLGYPLHPPGKPRVVRDEILAVRAPMLVVQGSRDAFGTPAELKKVLASMSRARVLAVAGGDHSLALPKKDGAEAQERALEGAASAVASFIQGAKKR
jgi:predicted alpha/beta-hydrolase family hydrolase